MLNIKELSVLIILVALTSCSSYSPIPLESPDKNVNIKIGMIADTQITTPYRTNGYLFRTMEADAVVNVAVRTSAQEYLAAEHLTYMMDSMAQESPDIIVYLGDAANSGCYDEITLFMDVMTKARRKHQIPTFLVVGNHDYLATGNQTDMKARVQACGDQQTYFTKGNLIENFSKFNNESAAMNTKNSDYQLTSYYDVLTGSNSRIKQACDSVDEEKQHTSGCYYAGIVQFESIKYEPISLLLTDTSDYADVQFLPALSEYLSFFGMRGSISWNSGQTDWFEEHLGSPSNLRIIASHYPVTDLGWNRFWMGRPGDLMSKEAFNLWLSAHTHSPEIDLPKGSIRYGTDDEGYKTVQHINVGSTTDYKPHIAIVDITSKSVGLKTVASLTSSEVKDCKQSLYDLHSQSPEIIEQQLGLTKAYREKGYDTQVSRKNLDAFLTSQANTNRPYWVKCLMNIASEREHIN